MSYYFSHKPKLIDHVGEMIRKENRSDFVTSNYLGS